MAPRSSKTAVVLCLFQSFAGLLFGWEQSSTSGLYIMPSYVNRFGIEGADGVFYLPTIRQSTIAGILSIGAFIGALSAGVMASRIGTRTTCIIFICIYIAGVAIETSAFQTYGQICVGRALAGLGIGATSGLVPVFQAEAAPPALRGLITGSFQMCVTLGIFLVNCTTFGMSHHTGDVTWRLPVGLSIIYALILAVGFFMSPESPRFLAAKGEWERAQHNLCRMRSLPADDPDIEIEMEEIRVAVEEDKQRGSASYMECLSMKDRIALRTLIGIAVQVGQQVTGINFYFSYGSIFAGYAGIDNPYVFIIILSAVNVIMSFPGILAVDRTGRRNVLIFGSFVMFAGQIIVGAVSTAKPGDPQAGKALIAFSCIFVAGFASTWGPIAWVVAAEVFPTRLAAKLTTVSAAANWGMNTIIAFVSPIVQQKIGTKITFVWAGFIAMSGVFVFFVVPETGGLSIEEIDALFISKTPAWRSKAFLRAQAKEENTTNEKRSRNSQHRENEKATSVNAPVSSEQSSVTEHI